MIIEFLSDASFFLTLTSKVGGYDGQNRLNTVEAYDPHTNTWHDVSPMKTGRSNFGIEVVEDRLFVVGGFSNHSTISDVEYYDSKTNDWYTASSMKINRSALSCCVLSGLPNMADYTIPREFLQIEKPKSNDMDV